MVYANKDVFQGEFKQGAKWAGTYTLADKTTVFYEEGKMKSRPRR
jgi:hypothetical protein